MKGKIQVVELSTKKEKQKKVFATYNEAKTQHDAMPGTCSIEEGKFAYNLIQIDANNNETITDTKYTTVFHGGQQF